MRMALSRARFLQLLVITVHGASAVRVDRKIASLEDVYSSLHLQELHLQCLLLQLVGLVPHRIERRVRTDLPIGCRLFIGIDENVAEHGFLRFDPGDARGREAYHCWKSGELLPRSLSNQCGANRRPLPSSSLISIWSTSITDHVRTTSRVSFLVVADTCSLLLITVVTNREETSNHCWFCHIHPL